MEIAVLADLEKTKEKKCGSFNRVTLYLGEREYLWKTECTLLKKDMKNWL